MDWFIILRVLRLTRVLKLSRHSSGMKDLGETISISLDAFSLTFFILVTGIVIFSSVMFYVEQGEGAFFDYDRGQWMRGDAPTDFQSIPGTFWWCIVTLTTVGYGEVVPFTSILHFPQFVCCERGRLRICILISRHTSKEHTTLVQGCFILI